MPRPERPLDNQRPELAEFAAGLRALREKAGNPSYRELSRRAHYSATALSEAAGGQKLPSRPVTLAYVRACEGDPAEWGKRWALAVQELNERADDESTDEQVAPYLGLSAFRAEDAARFFGREQLLDNLTARASQRRFLAVFGPSGSGKTSVLCAGLLSRIRAGAAPRPIVMFTPGQRPVEECAIHIARFCHTSAAEMCANLSADRRTLHRVVRQELDDHPDDTDLVVIIDQFEEIFTLCRDPLERQQFISMICVAAATPGSRIRVVLGIRADFYPHCASHPDLVEAMADGQVTVGPMTVDELRQAIVQPAVRNGYTVEAALLAELIAQASGQAGALPLLSHVLLQSWRRRRGNALTLAGYHAAGGMHGALAQTAERCYLSLDPAEQLLAKDLFLRLTTLGEGVEDTKRRVNRNELDNTDPRSRAVLTALVEARLITIDTETIEITHESLIKAWPRLHNWLNDNRADLRTHHQLADAAAAWEALNRDPDALYRGTRLAIAHDWWTTENPALTPRERDFLTASTRHKRRRVLARRFAAAGLVALTLVAGTAAVVAVEERSNAEFRQVVIEADRLRESDPSLSAQLTLIAHRLRPEDADVTTRLLSTQQRPLATPLAAHIGAVYWTSFSPNRNLLATAGDDHTVRLWDVRDRERPKPLGSPLIAHTGWVASAVFSPDGLRLITGGDDQAIKIWGIADPAHPVLIGQTVTHNGSIYTAAISPDGRTVATANDDRTIRLWNITDPANLTPLDPPLTGHTERVRTVAFSPNGQLLATGGNDHTVRLWNVADPGAPTSLGTPLRGHTDTVHSVAFSPDNLTLATASDDKSVRLWNVTDARPLGSPLTGHAGDVWQVAFSPDGRMLGSAGDSTVRLWNLSDLDNVIPLGNPLAASNGSVFTLTFSPDGLSLAVGGDDGTVRLWSLPTTVLIGHTAAVTSISISPDGRVLAAGTRDGTGRLWGISNPAHPQPFGPPLPGRTTYVSSVAFSPDGRILATSNGDSTVQLWNIEDPARAEPVGEPIAVNTRYGSPAVFSPDGRTLTTGSDDQTLQLWNITDPERPEPLGRPLPGHPAYVSSMAFSPDGHILATSGDADQTFQLWNTADPAKPVPLGLPLTAHNAPVRSLAFSPDGQTLATGSDDQTIRLWRLTKPAQPEPLGPPLTGHTDGVNAVRFSPDGRTLATGSSDKTLQLWNVTYPAHPARFGQPLTTGTDAAYVVAFNPNHNFLATGGGDGTVRIWNLDVESAIQRVCTSTNNVLTSEQWQQHIPQLDYDPPCAQ